MSTELPEERPRARGDGLVLQLAAGRVEVRLRAQDLAPGVVLEDLVLEVPEAAAGVDAGRGAAQFRHRLCELAGLELTLSEAALQALLARLDLGLAGLASLELALRPGFAEARGTLASGEAFTFKLGLAGGDDARLALVVHAPRLYAAGAAGVPPGRDGSPAGEARRSAAELPALVAASCRGLQRNGPSLVVDPLPALLRRLLPARGWKVPRTAAARLARADIAPGRLGVGWARGAPLAPADPDLSSALQGAQRFAVAEARLAAGDPDGARAAYLAAGEAATDHPHGLGRLLALLAAHPPSHPAALALASRVLDRRPGHPDALLAAARVEGERGEVRLSAEALAAAADALLRRGEESAALAAGEACLALGPSASPAASQRAADLVLSLSRGHLPALRALRARGEAGDREALLRACRRIAAYAEAPLERAEAHARLGTLLLDEDPAAARLHLDHAVRLEPVDPALLADLARALDRAGEPGRARQVTERLRSSASAMGDSRSAAEAAQDLSERARAAGDLARARDLLRDACSLGLPQEDAALAWSALAAEAAARGDGAAEGEALAEAVPRLSSGARSAALLRLSALQLLAGAPCDARRSAEAARALSPADPAAVEAVRAAALAQGDEAALPGLLAALADLVPARSGALQLERARRLAALGRALEADGARALALDALPPDLDLAREAAHARRGGPAELRARPWWAPLEAFALRSPDDALASAALREAARLAEAQGEAGPALRCARAAFARAPDDLARTGALLARLLYQRGAMAEALPLLRRLFEEQPAPAPDLRASPADDEGGGPDPWREEPAEPLRALAELAEDAGEVALAVSALDRLVALAPHDLQAARRRFSLDPDRRRGVEALAQAAAGAAAARPRAEALLCAAAAALTGLDDDALAGALAGEAGEALRRLEATAGPAAVDRVLSSLDPEAVRPALAVLRRMADAAATEDERYRDLGRAATLSLRCDDRGPEATAALEALAALALGRGEPGAPAIAERALAALARGGENARAGALLALAARAAQGVQRAAWLARLAETALARGDVASARAAREEALAAAPGDTALREAHLAEITASGDLPALLRALEAASLAPGAPAASLALRRAKALFALGNATAAVEALDLAATEGEAPEGWDEVASTAERQLEARGDVQGRARIALARARSATTPASRAAAFLSAASLLAGAGDDASAGRAAEQAREADPDQPGPWAALASLARRRGDPLTAARLLLATALRSEGPAAARAAEDAAELLEEGGQPGEAVRAWQAATAAVPGWPAARRTLARRASEAGDLQGAAKHLLALDPGALAADEQASAARALARALTSLRDPRAEQVWEKLFRADAADPEAFEALGAAARARGDTAGWLGLAAEHEGALSAGGDPLRRRDLRCARAELLGSLGQLAPAEGAWRAALAIDPHHRRALRGLRGVLARRGDVRGAVQLLACEAAAWDDPSRAAEVLLEGVLGAHEATLEPELSAALDETAARLRDEGGEEAEALLARLERARADLAPQAGAAREPPAPGAEPDAPQPGPTGGESDRGRAGERAAVAVGGTGERGVDGARECGSVADLGRAGERAAGAAGDAAPEAGGVLPPVAPAFDLGDGPSFDRALAEVRAHPGDRAALLRLLAAARTGSSGTAGERARRAVANELAGEVLAFLDGASHPLAGRPRAVPERERERALHPAASGPGARLLGVLAPWLERLFKADLERRGTQADDRLSPWHGPRIEAELDEARSALGAPRLTGYLTAAPGCEVALENTQPVALLLGAGVAALPLAERRFLLARACALAGLGATLPLRFAPRDVAVLVELACRFAGAEPALRLLPAERADLYLTALGRTAPPTERTRAAQLGPAAAAELPTLDPRALALGLRLTASRLALLHGGDLGAALGALRASERRLGALSPGDALADGELADLVAYALSREALDFLAAGARGERP